MESGFTSWERAGVRGVARRGANRQNQTLSPAILVRAGTSTGAIPPTSSIEAPRGLADVARLRVQSRRRDTSCSGPSVSSHSRLSQPPHPTQYGLGSGGSG